MYEQDYIMRLIKELVRAILKFLFHIDTELPTSELVEDEVAKERLERLLDMVDDGEINEAENRLYDLFNQEGDNQLLIALLFYLYLNEQTDDFLEQNDFSRAEVKAGVEYVADRFGLSSVAKAFLMEV